ncbi:FAD-binding oxidoreductase [Streptomyces sp. NPDC052396]|uniref:FAD-binding oxidoreductase n=1 Tax=Streptomyces sp. NPDC052396 TaxID=3365689 RepID=UPI0037D5C620
MVSRVSRRGFLGSAAAVAGAAAVGGFTPAYAGARTDCGPVAPEVIVRPGDARYTELATRGYNQRFSSSADEIWLVHSAEQVEKAVNQAVRQNQRITVRSGGHCFEGLVDDPQIRLLVDTSEMKGVTFDPRMNAFAVLPGNRLGEVYKALHDGWGVTLPAGVCPEVGVAGHVAGGGYGPLSRHYGLSVDHLHAVEVVVAGKDGRARTLVGTCDPKDPHHDLWWAHTGGGGGQFGIVTKYWFRTPGAKGEPGKLLPTPPERFRVSYVTWPWNGLTEAGFTRLVMNHGAWHAANSGPDSPYARMHSSLQLFAAFAGYVKLEIRMDATVPNLEQLHNDYIKALSAGVGVQPTVQTTDSTWLEAALTPSGDRQGYTRHKSMGGYLRKPFTDTQIAALYKSLTDQTHKGIGLVYLAAYGCKINTVAPTATAVAQRDSIIKLWYANNWVDKADDEAEVNWIRTLHGTVHASTGGVPVPNDQQDGCYINYPDIDIRNTSVNHSGVPWSTLLYKQNYPRLQRAKSTYDPRGVFRHTLSVDPA